jgi:hypothetical protein
MILTAKGILPARTTVEPAIVAAGSISMTVPVFMPGKRAGSRVAVARVVEVTVVLRRTSGVTRGVRACFGVVAAACAVTRVLAMTMLAGLSLRFGIVGRFVVHFGIGSIAG